MFMECHVPADPDERDGHRTGDAGAAPQPVLNGGPLVSSTALFGRHTEVGISHAGEIYRLRITRQGKLVLNK